MLTVKGKTQSILEGKVSEGRGVTWDFLCLEAELEKEVGPTWAQCQQRGCYQGSIRQDPFIFGLTNFVL